MFTKSQKHGKVQLKTYQLNFSLEGLIPGVDNMHHDVCLSSDFCKTSIKLIRHLLAMHIDTESIFGTDDPTMNFFEQKEDFKKICHQLMFEVVNKAKAEHNIRIDYLAQTAIVKYLLTELNTSYKNMVQNLEDAIREHEVTNDHEQSEINKKKLTHLIQNQNMIFLLVGDKLLEYFNEVQHGDLKKMREANFGEDVILPPEFFVNPVVHQQNEGDSFFTLDQYDILLGQRIEDPDRYQIILELIMNLILKMQDHQFDLDHISSQIKQVSNMDELVNYLQTDYRFKMLKKQHGPRHKLEQLKAKTKQQQGLLKIIFHEFKKTGLIQRMTAVYEMQSIYQEYCPPLVPMLILQFIIDPKSRKNIETRLKRLEKFYSKKFSLSPLNEVIKTLRYIKPHTRKVYLIRFLNGFARYHRDVCNGAILKTAMDNIRLVNDEKTATLSKTNNTLYEFLLPHEKTMEEGAIINHVIIKADVRGSTDITHRMMKSGLNPASFFSLNFFDPITRILSDYGAEKVFIEGDAIILSIFEREQTPEGWYSIARACGLAVNILKIVQQCNLKSRTYKLPAIELGIGISFLNTRPMFLFDNENRIMISSAINLADRLSGCSKLIRKKMSVKSAFNLYVFKTASDAEIDKTADDLSLRYNVNGIELAPRGFHKLKKEIDLKALKINLQSSNKEKNKFYFGKFPTNNGKYQRIIIREAQMTRIIPDTLTFQCLTDTKYYEVCTNPKLINYIMKIQNNP